MGRHYTLIEVGRGERHGSGMRRCAMSAMSMAWQWHEEVCAWPEVLRACVRWHRVGMAPDRHRLGMSLDRHMVGMSPDMHRLGMAPDRHLMQCIPALHKAVAVEESLDTGGDAWRGHGVFMNSIAGYGSASDIVHIKS